MRWSKIGIEIQEWCFTGFFFHRKRSTRTVHFSFDFTSVSNCSCMPSDGWSCSFCLPPKKKGVSLYVCNATCQKIHPYTIAVVVLCSTFSVLHHMCTIYCVQYCQVVCRKSQWDFSSFFCVLCNRRGNTRFEVSFAKLLIHNSIDMLAYETF